MNDAPIFSDGEQSIREPTLRGNSSGDSLGIIDRFSLVRCLGKGKFGVVYLARDTFSPVEYALKTVDSLRKATDESRREFEADFARIQKLHHEHIATVDSLHRVDRVEFFDSEESKKAEKEMNLRKGDPLVVMRYAPGDTLRTFREKSAGQVLSVADATEICRQIASALDYAHSKRVVHRDVKPSNIAVSRDPDGRLDVQVLDFGLATDIRDPFSSSDPTGGVTGTMQYMAPEQFRNETGLDGRADQYSLAAVLYELLEGTYPFKAAFDSKDGKLIRDKIENGQVNTIARLSDIQNLALRRALAKRKEDRFPSCTDFIDAFAGKIPVMSYSMTGEGAPAPAPAPASAPSAPEAPAPGGRPVVLSEDEVIVAQAWKWIKKAPVVLIRKGREGLLKAADSVSENRPKLREALKSRGLLPEQPPPAPAPEEEDAEPVSLDGGYVEPPSFASMAKPRITAVDLGDGVSFDMAGLSAGEFRMGSPHSEAGRQPGETQHLVRLSVPFHLAVAPVTQLKWKLVMGSLPEQVAEGDDLPVTGVSWDDCRSFLARLNETKGRPGYVWRLPTEAQWEFACRAGSYARFAGSGRIEDMAWYIGNSGGKVHPVKKKSPNAWGFYDMHGNVCEWCEDGWTPSLGNAERTNPRADPSGPFRVVRGGSWNHAASACRSASRMKMPKTVKNETIGFRVALVPES